ncbi:hypothetical protein [Rhodopseudomonas palustris]|uniref:hypothetical protein n=1 Tax=Rhodopseudomonas palustris TaxID=1076 RepID=UPI001602F16B|nr:hypothetical protein [Rhodopseudomonas palustris]
MAALAFALGALAASDFETEVFDEAGFDTEALEIVDLDPAVLVVRGSLEEVRDRLLVALRLPACLAPFEEALILRVFCDTACAWNRHAPVGCF